MKRISLILIMLLALNTLISTKAYALILDMGTFTRDTSSGLDWLDLTETVGQSIIQIANQLGIGGTYEGWRYASLSEIVDFWKAADIPDIDNGFTEDNYLPSKELQSLFGTTRITSDSFISQGLTADFAPNFIDRYWVARLHVRRDENTAFADPVGMVAGSMERSELTGSYLVKSTNVIPEPSTILLFTTGLLGAFVRKRKRN